MKNIKMAAPRNEGVTVMMAFDEKNTYINYCEKKGVTLSEMGRIAIKEKMSKDESQEVPKEWNETDKAKFVELQNRNDDLVRSNSIYRRNTIVLKELLAKYDINVPDGLLRSHSTKNRIKFPKE